MMKANEIPRREDYRTDIDRRCRLLSLPVRRYLYQITTAVVPLLITYGVLDESSSPLWIALAASVLATGTAAFHTPNWRTNERPERDS